MGLQTIGGTNVYRITPTPPNQGRTSTGGSWATLYSDARWEAYKEIQKQVLAEAGFEQSVFLAQKEALNARLLEKQKAIDDLRSGQIDAKQAIENNYAKDLNFYNRGTTRRETVKATGAGASVKGLQAAKTEQAALTGGRKIVDVQSEIDAVNDPTNTKWVVKSAIEKRQRISELNAEKDVIEKANKDLVSKAQLAQAGADTGGIFQPSVSSSLSRTVGRRAPVRGEIIDSAGNIATLEAELAEINTKLGGLETPDFDVRGRAAARLQDPFTGRDVEQATRMADFAKSTPGGIQGFLKRFSPAFQNPDRLPERSGLPPAIDSSLAQASREAPLSIAPSAVGSPFAEGVRQGLDAGLRSPENQAGLDFLRPQIDRSLEVDAGITADIQQSLSDPNIPVIDPRLNQAPVLAPPSQSEQSFVGDAPAEAQARKEAQEERQESNPRQQYKVNVIAEADKLVNRPKRMDRLSKPKLSPEDRKKQVAEHILTTEQLFAVNSANMSEDKAVRETYDKLNVLYADDPKKREQAQAYLLAMSMRASRTKNPVKGK